MIEKLKTEIMEMLINGEIELEKAISLPVLAQKLDCSVTPIRELMQQLSYASIVQNVKNRGFVIGKPNEKELTDLYELIVILEQAAIDFSIYKKENFLSMEMAQNQFMKAQNPYERFKADIIFHQSIIKNYDNDLFHYHLKGLKIRTFFCEFEYMQNDQNTVDSEHLHQKIIDKLKENNKTEAKKLIKENWLNILRILISQK